MSASPPTTSWTRLRELAKTTAACCFGVEVKVRRRFVQALWVFTSTLGWKSAIISASSLVASLATELRPVSLLRSSLHPVSMTRFPSFRTQPLENLSVDSVKNGFLSNPAPGENLESGNLAMETGCTCLHFWIMFRSPPHV